MGKKETLDTSNWIPAGESPAKANNKIDTSNWIPVKSPSMEFNASTMRDQIAKQEASDEAMLKSLENVEGLNSSEKQSLLDMKNSGKSKIELDDAVSIFTGKHPKQQSYKLPDGKGGYQYIDKNIESEIVKVAPELAHTYAIGDALGVGSRYYIKNGVPVPLAIGERPEAGYTVDSVWGSEKDAENDGRYMDISKKLFNLIPETLQGFVNVAEAVEGVTTNTGAPAFNEVKSLLDQFKFKTADKFNKGVVDTEKINNFSDLFKADSYDFSGDNVLNTTVNVGKSLLQLALTRGAMGLSSKASAASNFAASYVNNLGSSLEMADNAGVTGRGKYLTAMAVTAPMALIEQKLGIEGKIFNKAGQEAKELFIKQLIKDGVKIVDGKVTQESLDALFKETTKKAIPFYKKWSKDMIGEATEEVTQNMIQKAGGMIHDQIVKDDPEAAKYNANLFSAKSVAEYIEDAFGGLIGGAGGSLATRKQNRQSQIVYDTIKQGPEKINELKTNLTSSLKRGQISQDEFDRANFKIDAYKEYYDATAERNINDEDKRKIFDLTYQKQNLKSSIESLQQKNPNGINDGLIKSKEDQVSEINKQVNELWTKSENSVDPVIEAKQEIPEWRQTLNDFSKEVSNPDKTVSQSITKKDQIEQTVGLTPELNELSKSFKVNFKSSALPDDTEGIRVKDGVLYEPWLKKSEKEGEEDKIKIQKLPVYAFEDAKGESWLFAVGENTPDGEPKTSYLIKINNEGVYEGHEEFHYEAEKKNQLTFDDIPATFDRLKLKPLSTSDDVKEMKMPKAQKIQPTVSQDESTFNEVYSDVSSGLNTGTVVSLPNGVFGVNVNGKEIRFASSLTHLKRENLPGIDGKVNIVPIENVEGKFGKGLLVQNAETGADIGFLRATNQSKGSQMQEAGKTYEEGAEIEVPTELTPVAKDIVSKIEEDQDNYELVEDEFGKRYKNKKTGETYDRVSTFVSGKEGGDFKGDKRLKESAFKVGKIIDGIVKDFFNGKIKPYSDYKDIMSQDDYNDVIFELIDVHDYAEKNGFSIISKPLILADDKNKIAGQPNLLMIDKDGNVYVYDVVTVKNTNRTDFDNLFFTRYKDRGSRADRSAATVNIYADILKNKFGIDVAGVGAIPFEVNYSIAGEGRPQKISYVKKNHRVDFKRKQILNKAPSKKEQKTKPDGKIKPPPSFQKPKDGGTSSINKVVEYLRNANPKLNIIIDENIKNAGQVFGNEIRLNPNYAGMDTPIHEVAHIFIDSIGYKNRVIQSAINQLKETKLWKDTQERYPELSDEMLAKEVLAEAIGLEGEKIFDTEVAKNKFRQALDYIFDKIKQLFGIDRNIAKSLAKQVLSGGIESKGEETTTSLQKPKKTPKLTREAYYEKYFGDKIGIRLNTLLSQIDGLEKKLQEKLTPEEKSKFEAKLEAANMKLENFENSFKKYSYDYNKLNKVKQEDGNLDGKSIDELVEIYNLISEYDPAADSSFFAEVKYRIAHLLAEEQIDFLNKKGVDTAAAKFKDIKNKDVFMKALGHMSEAFPELQQLSKMYDSAVSSMQSERKEKLDKLQALAKDVIKEESNTLGIKVKDFTIGNAHKFFEWMDAGDGKFITVEQAKKLSPAKAKYLEYVKDLQEEYKVIQEKSPAGYSEDAALLIDKDFWEAKESNGIIAAIQKWVGSNETLRQVKMNFTNSNGKSEILSLGEIEQKLQQEASSGKISKVMAASKSVYYNMKAKRLSRKGFDEAGNVIINSDFVVDKKGKLINKFGIKRPEDFDYSKNFHAAAVQYINDMTWSKHMQPLVPIVESIEHFNSVTGIDRSQKANVVKWMKNWKAMHLYQEKKVGVSPELDLIMRTLRKWTSLAALAFNVPAAKMNFVIGEYNNWREAGTKDWAIGHKRLGTSKKGGQKMVSNKARAILDKYNVIATDYDERPTVHAGRLFDTLAQGLTRLAEYTIQGSLFLGQLTEQEWNDFDKDGNYTGKDPDILKKLESYKKRVSNVHGKYSAKDRRNFELYEFGRFIGQFKTWVPDWWKERFGERYFDENGKEHYGSWRAFQYQALSDLRRDVTTKEFWTSDDIKYKSMRTNLKSAMVFAALLVMRLSDDDDKKKRQTGDFLSQALGNLTFIFDPAQAKFVLKNPVAGVGTALKFVDALDSAIKAEKYKSDAKFGDKGDLVATGKIAQILPYNRIVFNDLFMDKEK